MSVNLCRPDGGTISTHASVIEAQTAAASMLDYGATITWAREREGRYSGTVSRNGSSDVEFTIEENADDGRA